MIFNLRTKKYTVIDKLNDSSKEIFSTENIFLGLINKKLYIVKK